VSVDIVPAWKHVTPQLQAELLELWDRHDAISDPGVAAARARQAVCVARDGTGANCAVSTAILRVLPRLRQPMYYYRQFVTEAFRVQKQAIPFFNAGRAILQAHNASLASPESIGVLVELENAVLDGQHDRVCVEEAGSVFLGYSPRGLQLRATYFEGARLCKPPAVRQRKAIPA
jgi:hypothetical protein